MKTIMLGLLLGSLAVSELRAQVMPTDSATRVLYQSILSLRPGANVRMHAGDAVINGKYRTFQNGQIGLDAAGSIRQISVTELDTLWVKRSKYKPMLWGAVIGFTAMSAAVLGSSGDDPSAYEWIPLVAPTFGALPGGLIGLLIGQLRQEYVRKFP